VQGWFEWRFACKHCLLYGLAQLLRQRHTSHPPTFNADDLQPVPEAALRLHLSGFTEACVASASDQRAVPARGVGAVCWFA